MGRLTTLDPAALGVPAFLTAAVERAASLLGAPTSGSLAAGAPDPHRTALADGEVLALLTGLGTARVGELADARTSGVVYTPPRVAASLVALAGVGSGDTVCDPAVGGGVFLVAAAEALRLTGSTASEVESSLLGADIDPAAVAVTRAVLALWSWWRFGELRSFDSVEVADTLVAPPGGWAGRVDVVLGNPPFLGQLKSGTARDLDRLAALRDVHGAVVTPYVDEAALFLLAASSLVRDSGRVCLIVPASVLASASSAPIRREIDGRLPLRALWVGGSDVFPGVTVEVVAPVLGGVGPHEAVPIHLDAVSPRSPLVSVAPVGFEWQRALAAAASVPVVAEADGFRLGAAAEVTADFRDAYYWLAERVCDVEDSGEAAGLRRLATVGLVDPLHFRHGGAEVRFARRRYRRPMVDPALAPTPGFERWVARRSVPKILVATQTRVVECVVDSEGSVLPSTPLLVVEPHDPRRVWHLAAAIGSPYVSAWAAGSASGTGLSGSTFRLRASQLGEAPLPAPSRAWDEAAALARRLHRDGAGESPPAEGMLQLGELMNEAYGRSSDAALLDWWFERLPRRG